MRTEDQSAVEKPPSLHSTYDKSRSAVTHRLSAGGLVFRNGDLLMVRHFGETGEHFWIPPGGGMEPGEGALACAEREVFEETGVRVRAEKVVYVQEVVDAKHHHAKFWVLCQDLGGEICREHLTEGEHQDLLEARFLSEYETRTLNVPTELREVLWKDAAEGFSQVRYLGQVVIAPSG